jgi:GNAT superfamily N-acetyltransferase
MQLIQVRDKATAREFIMVNVLLNKGNPNYIRPLDHDVEAVFDPKKNKAFRHGEVIRWILKDKNGALAGRIAAFVNKKYKTRGDEGPVGGIGFFDCINNQEAADMLFDVAGHWLRGKGMYAMDGPINFGERDRWWGLLVDGFQSPLYCMNYNPPYYQSLFEHYGFKVFFNQVCLGRNAKNPVPQKLVDRHAMYANNPAFKARHIDKSNLEKFAEDFTVVYNKAWAGHGGLKEMRKDQAMLFLKKMKAVMDERIVWFAYHNDEPIAIFVNLPDLNQWFRYLNGKFDLLHKLKFLWYKRTRPCRRFLGIIFGVTPEFQGKGIDAFIIVESAKLIQPHTDYQDYEMQWIGDFNPKMINVAESIGDTFRTRKLITYRYLFDRTQEFKRHPILN